MMSPARLTLHTILMLTMSCLTVHATVGYAETVFELDNGSDGPVR